MLKRRRVNIDGGTGAGALRIGRSESPNAQEKKKYAPALASLPVMTPVFDRGELDVIASGMYRIMRNLMRIDSLAVNVGERHGDGRASIQEITADCILKVLRGYQ
jgi:hypothetical protein